MASDTSGDLRDGQTLQLSYRDLKDILRVALSSKVEENRKKLISYAEAMHRLGCKGSKFRELLNHPESLLIQGAIKGTILESSVDQEIDRLCGL
ncbi:MAG: hypothetical protein RLP14_05945 [Owenweeksia sp.]